MAATLRIAAALTLALAASPLRAEEAQDYEVLGVDTSMKLSGSLHFGRVIIQVDSNDPKKVLATASAVAHSIIDRGTLDAIQLFAYAKTPQSGYDTADITYSPDPKFMSWNGWRYSASAEKDEAWFSAAVGFDPGSVTIPVGFPDPSGTIVDMCDNLRRCSIGQTDLGMP